MSEWKLKLLSTTALLSCVVWLTTSSQAAIIASEDFESYTAVVGDPGPDFGNSGENGGSGWTTEWDMADVPIQAYVRDALLPGFGKGLEIRNRDSADSNILTRQFPVQTDDVYVGMTIRTTMDVPEGNNHTYIYFSDTTGDDINLGYGAGTLRVGSGGPGDFMVQQGDNTSRTTGSISQVYGDLYNLVFKFSKSGSLATDPFDSVDLWINQATEGVADISSTTGTAALSDLSTFHVWFDPRNMTAPEQGQLAIDNLVVATTYDEALSLASSPQVPEPSSAILFGIAGTLLMVRLQRRL